MKILFFALWFLFTVAPVYAQSIDQEFKNLIDKIAVKKCQPNIWDRLSVRHPQEQCLMDSASRLGTMGQSAKAAVPVLIEALKTYPNVETGDGILPVRSTIAQALGEIGDESAVPALMDILRSEDEVSIASTASLLPSYKPETRSSYGSVITALGMLGPKAKEALPLLVPFLACSEDPDQNSLVCDAVDAVGQISDPSTIPLLTQILNNPSCGCETQAAEALGNFGSQAVGALADLEMRLNIFKQNFPQPDNPSDPADKFGWAIKQPGASLREAIKKIKAQK